MKYSLIVTILTLCFGGIHVSGQTQPSSLASYVGKIDVNMELAWAGYTPLRFSPATPEDLKKLDVRLKEGDKVFASGTKEGRFDLAWFITQGQKTVRIKTIALLLVETPEGELSLFADLDSDGHFSSTECFQFSQISPKSKWRPVESWDALGVKVNIDKETELRIPLPGSFLPYYVVNVFWSKSYDEVRKRIPYQGDSSLRFLWQPLHPVAKGVVNLAGREVTVQFEVDPRTGEMLPTGYRGMDCDGDGKISNSVGSIESAYVFDENELPVFHVGEHYLSIDQFDRVTGRITLKERLASDYARTELVKGAELPDFTFIDLDGHNGRLSDFRGKFLLLDFWGTWCSGCRAEVPYYKAAYKKYRSRGFEILGVDAEETRNKLAKFVAEQAITWRQATAESTAEWVTKKLRIQDHGYPTRVLLDPQGKILSLGRDGELPLGGRELMETVEQLLSEKSTSAGKN